MTNILALPQLSGSLTIATNGDLRESIQFVLAGTSDPLDLTGISFRCQMRPASASGRAVALDLSTENKLLANRGSIGVLAFVVPQEKLRLLAPGAYVADLIAKADGVVINMFSAAPLAVTVNGGVTCSS